VKQLGYAQKDGKHFFDIGLTEGYTEMDIMNCPDPDGGSNTEMPTAVPSPFARFDLIKTAFENIEKTENLKADADGKRASRSDEKHVSHTLDLAEIIFDYSAHADKLGILKWSRSKDLSELAKSHESFADSLLLYLKLDAKAYNFDKMENIFLFRFDTNADNIIGSTSPITLFCPSAAKLDRLGIIRPKDKKPYFGDAYLPLYERSPDFQRWFYALLGYFSKHGIADRNLRDGSLGLHVVRKYADKSKKFLYNRRSDPDLVKDLDRLYAPDTEQDFVNSYSELHVAGTNNPVDVLGVVLRVPDKEGKGEEFDKSDFVIAPTKTIPGDAANAKKLPLALQNGFTRPGFKYGDGDFTPDIVVPSFAKGSWREAEREMPGLGSRKGSYVTVSDFLEPYLVRTIYPISKNFLAFDKTDKVSLGYLYPLKKEFFEFFSIKSLNANGPENPKITLVFQDDGSVKVSLEVPIKKYGHKVTFERVYKESKELPDQSKPDGGVIVTKRFGVTVFPFVKTNGYIKGTYGVEPDYRVQFIDSDLETTFSDLEFYSEAPSVAPVKKIDIAKDKKNIRINKAKGGLTSSEYYEIGDEFDFIQVKTDRDIKALVIPKWKEVSDSGKKYTFAVDFGTTNTHIAYSVGGSPSEPFDITGEGNDVQIATLFDETNPKTYENLLEENAVDINELLNKEFVPKAIGKGKDYVFPQRTALAYNAEMPDERWKDGLDPLTESNIPFCYEKMQLPKDEIVTNLKWNTKDEDPYKSMFKMNAYLKQIVMLLQNKVLANGGSLKGTRLIWFYPSSMSKNDQENLGGKWKEYFERYFGKVGDDSSKVKGVMESLAPYYAQNEPKFGGANVLSIDIGGGTTDAAVFFDGKLKGTTSFKFAGNALFGDAYSPRGQGADKNGFVIRFAKRFEELLSGEFSGGADVLSELQKKKKADDINAFFFSVENNIELWTKQARQDQGKTTVNKDPYSYSVMIRNNGQDLMFLILYFYVALIYHIGQVLKSMDGEPIKLKFVIFSGTASKILRILTKSKESLTKLTVEVFKQFGLADDNLEIKLAEEPKEATCKGGLSMDFGDKEATQNSSVKPLVYSCVKNGLESATYNDYLEDVNKKDESLIRKNLVEFHKFFFSLDDPDRVEFSDFFGIDSVVTKYVKGRYERLISDWLESAVIQDQRIYNVEKEKKAQETPFFMPLKGIIQDLSFEIANYAYNKKS